MLKKCILRIPSNSKLHLIFCDTVSDRLLERTDSIVFDVGTPPAEKRVEVLRVKRHETDAYLEYPSRRFGDAWGAARCGRFRPDFVVVIVALADLVIGDQENVSLLRHILNQ